MKNLTALFDSSRRELPEGITQPYADIKPPSFENQLRTKTKQLYGENVASEAISTIHELIINALPDISPETVPEEFQNIYRLNNGSEVMFLGTQVYLLDPTRATITPEQASATDSPREWRQFLSDISRLRQADGKTISYNLLTASLDISMPRESGGTSVSTPLDAIDKQSIAFKNLEQILELADRRGLQNMPQMPTITEQQPAPSIDTQPALNR